MRMLLVDFEREWRGGQSQAWLTLRGLRQRGQQAELLAPTDSPLAKRCAAAGVPVHAASRFALRTGTSGLARERMLRGGYAIIHLNEPHALTAAWLIGAQKKAPLLLSRRIGFPLRHGWGSTGRYAAIARFVANSNQVAQSLMDSGISAQRISVVNEGVDIPPPVSAAARKNARALWSIRDGDFLFGCASVFVPEKGQRHLLEALPAVRQVHPEARLLLAGAGPCLAELQALARRLGQADAVLFPGFVEDMEQFYAALDAFAFPSEFEGLGTALQAAMATGLPCISTRRGALAEVVDGGGTTLVVEPNTAEFSAAMLRVIEDRELRVRLGEAGKRDVTERFSSARMVENTLQVYRDVIEHWPLP